MFYRKSCTLAMSQACAILVVILWFVFSVVRSVSCDFVVCFSVQRAGCDLVVRVSVWWGVLAVILRCVVEYSEYWLWFCGVYFSVPRRTISTSLTGFCRCWPHWWLARSPACTSTWPATGKAGRPTADPSVTWRVCVTRGLEYCLTGIISKLWASLLLCPCVLGTDRACGITLVLFSIFSRPFDSWIQICYSVWLVSCQLSCYTYWALRPDLTRPNLT